MGLGEDLYDIFLNLIARHRHELGRKDRNRDVVMRPDVRPVLTNHLEYTATDAVTFDGRLCDFFTHHNRDATMNAMFVLAVLEQDRAVSDCFAVTVKVTKAAMAMESVFLS